MTSEIVKIDAPNGGKFDAYLSRPESGPGQVPGPGIVMLQEIFGLTPWIKKTADMFASRGYLVIAPDVFWRLEPNFIGDPADEELRNKGFKYRGELDFDAAVGDMDACAEFLKTQSECNGKIGVTGFCLGGTLAYLAATRLNIDASVAYYGTQIHEYLEEGKNISCPTMLHLGKQDDHVPEELQNKIHAALIGIWDISIYTYEAGHAFANTDRDDAYDAAASELSHRRTFEMFDRLTA